MAEIRERANDAREAADPRAQALRKTNSLWSRHTGHLLGLGPGEAERIGLWAEGLGTYLSDGDATCDGMITQVSRWAELSGVEGNGDMAQILDAWSPVIGVDIESAWESCVQQ